MNTLCLLGVVGVVLVTCSNSFLLPRTFITRNNVRSSTTMNAKIKDATEVNKGEVSPLPLSSILNGIEINGVVHSELREDLLSALLSASSTSDILCKDPTSGEEDDKESFEIHVGRALDTLRKDYPDILTENPDFAIYDKDLEVVDPSGVKVHGVKNYKNAFRLLHAVVNVFYCPERSGLTFRLCYDTARHSIRVHWNAEVIPREIFGGVKSPLHVDGISVYEFNQISGKIIQHRIEQLLINDMPVRPRQGIVAALNYEHSSLPAFSKMLPPNKPNTVLEFKSKSNHKNNNDDDNSDQSLFSLKASSSTTAKSTTDTAPATTTTTTNDDDIATGTTFSTSTENNNNDIDWDAYERKNISRKKFGLKPLSPEEFMELESEIQKLDTKQRNKGAAAAAQQAAAAAEMDKNEKSKGFFDKLFGNVVKDTCVDNFDCERPEVCCDFGFKKMCCSSGQSVFNGPQSLYGQPAFVPVPADVGYPEGRGGPMDNPPTY